MGRARFRGPLTCALARLFRTGVHTYERVGGAVSEQRRTERYEPDPSPRRLRADEDEAQQSEPHDDAQDAIDVSDVSHAKSSDWFER